MVEECVYSPGGILPGYPSWQEVLITKRVDDSSTHGEDKEVICRINNGSCSYTTGSGWKCPVGPEGTDSVVTGATDGTGDIPLEETEERDLRDQGASEDFQGGHWAYR